MEAKKKGAIINVASVAAFSPIPFMSMVRNFYNFFISF